MDSIVYGALGFTGILVGLELLYLAYLRYQKSRHRWCVQARMAELEGTDSGVVVVNIDADRRIDVPEPIVTSTGSLEKGGDDNFQSNSDSQLISDSLQQGKLGFELTKSRPTLHQSSANFGNVFNSNSLWNLSIQSIACITNSFAMPSLQARRMRSILFTHLVRAQKMPRERANTPATKCIELPAATTTTTSTMLANAITINEENIEVNNNNTKIESSIEFELAPDTSSAQFQVHTGTVRWQK